MRHRHFMIAAALAFSPWLLTTGCNGGDDSEPTDPGTDTSVFSREVLPIFDKCMPCHSAQNATANLVLESYDGLLAGGVSGSPVSKGDAADSLIIKRVTADGFGPMPPAGDPLTNEEIETLKKWIDAGALKE